MKTYHFIIFIITTLFLTIGNYAENYGVAPHNRDLNYDKWALLISIDNYRKEGQRLNGTNNDMNELARVLIKKYGFNNNCIFRLRDQDATKKNILDALAILRNRAKGNRVIVFGYSGHGSRAEDDEPDEEADGYDETICPYDRDSQGDIRDDTLYKNFSQILSGGDVHLVSIFDSCYSGTVYSGEKVKTLRSIHTPDDQTIEPSMQNINNRFVNISACSYNEVALEKRFKGKYHGVFSYYLIDVLEKAGDLVNTDGEKYTTWKNIQHTLINNVAKRSVQRPQFIGNMKMKLFENEEKYIPLHFIANSINETKDRIEIQNGIITGLQVGAWLAVYKPSANFFSSENLLSYPLENLLGIYEVDSVELHNAKASLKKGKEGEIIPDGSYAVEILPSIAKFHIILSENIPKNLKKIFQEEIDYYRKLMDLVQIDNPKNQELESAFYFYVNGNEENLSVVVGPTEIKFGIKEKYQQIFTQKIERVKSRRTVKYALAKIVDFIRWQRFKNIYNPTNLDISDKIKITLQKVKSNRDKIIVKNGKAVTIDDKINVDSDTEGYVFQKGDIIQLSYTNLLSKNLYISIVFLSSDLKISFWNQLEYREPLKQGQSVTISNKFMRITTQDKPEIDYIKIFAVSDKPLDLTPFIQDSRGTPDTIIPWIEPFFYPDDRGKPGSLKQEFWGTNNISIFTKGN